MSLNGNISKTNAAEKCKQENNHQRKPQKVEKSMKRTKGGEKSKSF